MPLDIGAILKHVAGNHIPLIGRNAELAVLVRTLGTARSGEPSIVIVSGEAGIGKTRLVEELVERAQTDGFLVATGRCSPVISTRLPYGPVVDLIADVLRQCPDLQGLVPPEAWQGVAPLTGRAAPTNPGTPDLNLASTRLFAGFAEVLAVESRRRPVLLVVEDIHWADPASVDLLAFAARKLRGSPIVLLLTNRPAGAPRRSPVRSALAELRRLDITVDLQLDVLVDAAVAELLDVLPEPPGTLHRERITALAEGIPFFALHLAARQDDGAVPARLRDVLLSSIDELSEGERAVLILLTVMGDVEDDLLLAVASGMSPNDFTGHARALMERGIVLLRGGAIGFRHALLREVMIEDTLPSERVLAHSRVADAMLSAGADRQLGRAGQVAHHLLECGRYPDAIRFAVRGARQAGAVWAFADSRNLYNAVRRLWPLVDAPEAAADVAHAEILREAAMVSRWCGDFDEATELLVEALRSAVLTPGQRVLIEHSLGQVRWAAADMVGAIAAFRRAEVLIPPTTDDRLRSAVLAALAQGLMASGQARKAEMTAHTAAELAATVGADRERIHASITEAAARAQQGDVEAAIADLRILLPQARRLDDLELVLRCYGNLTFALGITCRYEDLAAVAAEGVQVCRRYGPVLSLASSLMHNRVNALVTLGRWDEAVAVAQEALNERTNHQVALHLRLALAEVAIDRGDAPEADLQLTLAGDLAADDPGGCSAISVVRAQRALWVHDPSSAVTQISQALPVLQAQEMELPLLEACWLGLRGAADVAATTIPLRRVGNTETGHHHLLDIARSASEGTDLPVASAMMLASQAEADRILGSDSADQWDTAARANATLQRPYARAYCLLRLAAVQLRGRARSAATASLMDALRTATELGARPLLAEVETLATISGLRLDVPPENNDSPSFVSPHGLTARERQVLSLLRTGATNRVIGRTLFISERTASVHVSNVLAKLGAANRTEAARLALGIELDVGHS